MYVQLSYPGKIPPNAVPGVPAADLPAVFYPTLNRVGHAVIRRSTGERRVLRAVHLYSFSFLLALFHPNEGARAREELIAEVPRNFRGSMLLRPSRPTELLECDGMDAWESFSRSRDFRFPNGRDQ
jgi:hypothetical protein